LQLSVRYYSLAQEGNIEKAVALAVFHMNIKLAINELNRFPARTPQEGVTLRLVATALAGYIDGGGGQLWRSSCEPLRLSVQDPYISAVFAFLLNTKPEYWSVLVESEMSLRDKIAFACRFLDDERVRPILNYKLCYNSPK